MMEQNITTSDLQRLALLKYGPVPERGWGPRMRDRFGYFTPDDWYETLVDQLVTPSTRWLRSAAAAISFRQTPSWHPGFPPAAPGWSASMKATTSPTILSSMPTSRSIWRISRRMRSST